MEVALLVAGVSTGAFLGALGALIMGRSSSRKLAISDQIGCEPWRAAGPSFPAVTQTALVPCGRPPKARRLNPDAQAARDRFNQEVIALRQDLELCRAAEAQSCAQLRDGQLSHCEMQQHVTMLSLLGQRLGLDSSLIAALPDMASGVRCRSPAAMNVLAAFEGCLRDHAAVLERRLCEMCELREADPCLGFKEISSCPQLVLTDLDLDAEESDCIKGRGGAPLVEEIEDDEPCFVNYWEDSEVSPKVAKDKQPAKHFNPRRAPKRPASQISKESPTELMLLTLLEHGTAKDMSVIKGLNGDDIKKVLAHRRSGAQHRSLEMLPAILGRKISIPSPLCYHWRFIIWWPWCWVLRATCFFKSWNPRFAVASRR